MSRLVVALLVAVAAAAAVVAGGALVAEALDSLDSLAESRGRNRLRQDGARLNLPPSPWWKEANVLNYGFNIYE